MTNGGINSLSHVITGAAAGGLRLNSIANTVLKTAAGLWFLVAVTGQWVFVAFIVSFYGGAALRGDFEAWNKLAAQNGIGDKIPHGYVAGDIAGNLILGMHLLLAASVIFGLPLQLIPQIRTLAPAFHRWNGRLILVAAFAIVSAGLYLILSRGSVSGPYFKAGNIINAVLIIASGVMTLRYALARRMETHRRWALRLFVLVNAVWFLRVGFFLWMMINQGPVGHNNDFTGSFDIFAAFAHVLLPLAVLEIYLLTKDRAGASGKFAMAAGLFVLTAGMGVGAFGFSTYIWLQKF
ncbi:MAG TPA: DUF2306 domain-containing protein [Gammaproteobacteria bacterium]|nr:DUF2306 domain-containing protein [Gammaproteobacteria bacterium]